MLHSVVITNAQGVLLLSRYWGGGCEAWDSEGATCRAAWERHLWALGAPWGVPGAELGGVGMIGQWTVLWRPVAHEGGLVVFLAGDDEYDELVLHDEVLPLVRLVVCEHASSDGRKVTEAALLRTDAFGKVVASFEELVREGYLLHASIDSVLKMSKLKKVTGSTSGTA
mmetsp:Transcript_46830/g.92658  ORF Transcript_46830/g.92658 Transcript_46830/m.92658 type:complete len:169 (-) Transcript_46830:251-757(-)